MILLWQSALKSMEKFIRELLHIDANLSLACFSGIAGELLFLAVKVS